MGTKLDVYPPREDALLEKESRQEGGVSSSFEGG